MKESFLMKLWRTFGLVAFIYVVCFVRERVRWRAELNFKFYILVQEKLDVFILFFIERVNKEILKQFGARLSISFSI